jgi:rSAM/selenodomain-associated transferase 2
MNPRVTIITPVLGDADALRALLQQFPVTPDLAILVVDGGMDPQIEVIVKAHDGSSVRRSPPGRAIQMNAGAAGATSEWLLFLHADSTLPPGWLDALGSLGDAPAGGWFRFGLDDPAWQARLIERLVAWRVRRLHLPFGDQGIFVRRRIFEHLGGFRDMPLMEDIEFVRRLVRAGPVAELPLTLHTSSRRWRRDGWCRRSLTNLTIQALYFAGVPPARLARWYHGGRRR